MDIMKNKSMDALENFVWWLLVFSFCCCLKLFCFKRCKSCSIMICFKQYFTRQLADKKALHQLQMLLLFLPVPFFCAAKSKWWQIEEHMRTWRHLKTFQAPSASGFSPRREEDVRGNQFFLTFLLRVSADLYAPLQGI